MYDLYERIAELCNAKGVSVSRMCLDVGMSKSTLSGIKCGRKKGLSTANAAKVAEYLGVSMEYLLGASEEPNAIDESRPITDDDLMYALFDGAATPEQLEEVKRFAAYVKARDNK